jgi:small subunit ribosomal protein S3e
MPINNSNFEIGQVLSKRRQFVADGVFRAEIHQFF